MQPQDPNKPTAGGAIYISPDAADVVNDYVNRRMVRGAKVAKLVPYGMVVAFLAIAALSIGLAVNSGNDDRVQDQRGQVLERKLDQENARWQAQEAKENAAIDKALGKK